MARVRTIFCFLFFLLAGQVYAQETNSPDTASAYQERTERLVSFLQYMLNTVGNSNTSTRDKDVIITQSYAKIFRDDDVQIEDDLLENRQVVTNKDVTAYLKDVEFFYSDVSFEFDIINITEETGEDDRPFIKVQLERELKGLTIE
ncbi:MAG: leucine-rich repeat domain-containing protein, partial [Bacteroidota bacterium]